MASRQRYTSRRGPGGCLEGEGRRARVGRLPGLDSSHYAIELDRQFRRAEIGTLDHELLGEFRLPDPLKQCPGRLKHSPVDIGYLGVKSAPWLPWFVDRVIPMPPEATKALDDGSDKFAKVQFSKLRLNRFNPTCSPPRSDAYQPAKRLRDMAQDEETDHDHCNSEG